MNYQPPYAQAAREKGEPTLPLINIVFLMLIFFLVTAQMARPLDPDIQLVNTDDPNLVPPPDAVVITASGELRFRGASATPENVFTILRSEQIGDITVRILPDGRASAAVVIALAKDLHDGGAQAIFIMTEQAF
ncbi:biopolymer transporter ExbD [Cognatiyoonia sp. IB215182]|uniref:ExbD/TolR family protein n=1 Tax=Cognatiyoonia sp. IB215182 TaxID=3097353 RepID=UPI002A175770|nr:biopolymer transporter ExbD [Cognatiyoonia sp. IB215182]MDX8355248.1 biopolymer transporter ExbD [Cognatiyoonia sp. IB215182]